VLAAVSPTSLALFVSSSSLPDAHARVGYSLEGVPLLSDAALVAVWTQQGVRVIVLGGGAARGLFSSVVGSGDQPRFT